MNMANFLKEYGILATAFLGVIGYFIKSLAEKNERRRLETLDLLNKRIEEFYGPLYFRLEEGRRSYETLLEKLGKEFVQKDATEQDLLEWRDWYRNVFHPSNLQIEKIIIEKSYLTTEDEIPKCLIDFVIHFSGYKVLIVRWNNGDFSENFSTHDFPSTMKLYLHESYNKLKKQQIELIEKISLPFRI